MAHNDNGLVGHAIISRQVSINTSSKFNAESDGIIRTDPKGAYMPPAPHNNNKTADHSTTPCTVRVYHACLHYSSGLQS